MGFTYPLAIESSKFIRNEDCGGSSGAGSSFFLHPESADVRTNAPNEKNTTMALTDLMFLVLVVHAITNYLIHYYK